MTTAAYLRVSTGRQSIDQQHDAIASAGIAQDNSISAAGPGRSSRAPDMLSENVFDTPALTSCIILLIKVWATVLTRT
jgi:hypothetical protein